MVMKWEAFLSAVQERGEYPSQQEAERVARVVLALLGAHVVGSRGPSWPPGFRRPAP